MFGVGSAESKNVLHLALGAVGLLALAAYVIACRASFSPDGTKILFSYVQPEAKQVGVAVYDRKAGTTRPIYISTRSRDSDEGLLAAQWDREGTRAIRSPVWRSGTSRRLGTE